MQQLSPGRNLILQLLIAALRIKYGGFFNNYFVFVLLLFSLCAILPMLFGGHHKISRKNLVEAAENLLQNCRTQLV